MTGANAKRIGERLWTLLHHGPYGGLALHERKTPEEAREVLALLESLKNADRLPDPPTKVPAELPTSCVIRVVAVDLRPDDRSPVVYRSEHDVFVVPTNGPEQWSGEIRFVATPADADALRELLREPVGLVGLRRTP